MATVLEITLLQAEHFWSLQVNTPQLIKYLSKHKSPVYMCLQNFLVNKAHYTLLVLHASAGVASNL